jgi:hypothetical protein
MMFKLLQLKRWGFCGDPTGVLPVGTPEPAALRATLTFGLF